MVILVEFKKNERFLQNSPSSEYALLFLPLNVQLLLNIIFLYNSLAIPCFSI